MAFKEVQDLNCETTIALGGINKQTGKPNATKIEGYYLGKREVADRKKKSGTSYIYAFQTANGNVGVWGKTDLDRKMSSVTLGTMVRVTQNGTRDTPNGPMYVFKIEFDADNTIEVTLPNANTEADGPSYEADAEETDPGADETALDEVSPARAKAPARPGATVTAAQQARTQALLSGRKA